MPVIDPYYFLFDGIGYPDNYHPIETPEGFNVYLLCDTENRSKTIIYQDRDDFANKNIRADEDRNRLFSILAKKLLMCEKANDLFDLYDDTELHKAHETKINGKTVKVYRIRKSDVRVYLIFLGADIVIFRLSIKLKNKLSSTEKQIIDNRVKVILQNPPSIAIPRLL